MKNKNSRNNFKKTAFAAISLLVLFTPIIGYAAATPSNVDSIVIEKTFSTINEHDKADSLFHDTYEQDGILYDLDSVKTEVIKTENTTGDIYLYTTAGVSDKNDLMEPETTIDHNNSTYVLKSKELKETEKKAITKHTERTVRYTDMEDNDQIPGLAEIQNKDNTGTTVSKYMPLIKYTIEKEKWESTFEFPIKVTRYDANSYMLNGIEVEKGTPLINYKFELLEYLGLSEHYYRINTIEWNGEEYKENGTVCRKATARGDKVVKEITALYGGEMTFGSTVQYAYECTYVSENKPGTTIYTIKASASYVKAKDAGQGKEPGLLIPDPSSNSLFGKLLDWIIKNPAVALGIGTLVVVIIAVLILFILAKKKSKVKKSNFEIIDIVKKNK